MIDSILDFFADIWLSLKSFVFDILVSFIDAILSAIAFVIESLPLPDFILSYSLSDFIPADVSYFLALSGFGSCLYLIGSAYAFRILRRVVTLGIW